MPLPRAHEVSVDLVIAAAEIIAAYMAAGESEISRTDLKLSGRRSVPLIGARQSQRLMRYLAERGHLDRDDRELIRPVGIRPPELPLSQQPIHGESGCRISHTTSSSLMIVQSSIQCSSAILALKF